MTLTTLNDNQPEWVKAELGLEIYKEFKLGQKVKFHNDLVYIIHIQELDKNTILFRGILSNGASITMTYDLINKPVETTNEQPKDSLTFDEEDLKPLYHLLSRTNSRKYMDELEVYLERLAFIIG